MQKKTSQSGCRYLNSLRQGSCRGGWIPAAAACASRSCTALAPCSVYFGRSARQALVCLLQAPPNSSISLIAQSDLRRASLSASRSWPGPKQSVCTVMDSLSDYLSQPVDPVGCLSQPNPRLHPSLFQRLFTLSKCRPRMGFWTWRMCQPSLQGPADRIHRFRKGPRDLSPDQALPPFDVLQELL